MNAFWFLLYSKVLEQSQSQSHFFIIIFLGGNHVMLHPQVAMAFAK